MQNVTSPEGSKQHPTDKRTPPRPIFASPRPAVTPRAAVPHSEITAGSPISDDESPGKEPRRPRVGYPRRSSSQKFLKVSSASKSPNFVKSNNLPAHVSPICNRLGSPHSSSPRTPWKWLKHISSRVAFCSNLSHSSPCASTASSSQPAVTLPTPMTASDEQRPPLSSSSLNQDYSATDTGITTGPVVGSPSIVAVTSSVPSVPVDASRKTCRKKLYKTPSCSTSLERRQFRIKAGSSITQRRSRIRGRTSYKRFNIDQYVEYGKPYIGPYLSDLLKMHLLQQKQKQVRYSFRNKWLATNIFLAVSLSGYSFLKRIISLPSPSTILRFLRQYKVQPGISDFNTTVMRVKVNPTSALDKVCFILIDEMSLRAGLAYDSKNDIIAGFCDDGLERTTKLVKSAFCVMAVGLASKWKYPLGFHFAESVMQSSAVAEVIQRSITMVQAKGFIVKGITSDQGSNLVRAFKLLGYAPGNPTINVDGHQYVVFRDPPHLLKCARNFLLNNDVRVPGFEAHAKWQHVIDFYNADSLRSIKFAPRVTARHVFDLKFANKMKVNLAAQVLSNSCAAALDATIALNQSDASSAATSTYLKKFNDLFDVFNSSSSKDKVPLRKPYRLTESSASSEFLNLAKSWLLELQEMNSHRRNSFISGWIENITALSLLSEDLRPLGMKFLSVRNLCQDPLELFFCKIRQMKRFPTALNFSDCFSRTATASLLRAPATGNCEEAVADRLHKTEDLLSLVSFLVFLG